MPIAWQIRDGLVRLETTDAWTIDEWKTAAEAFIADPGFRPGMGIVNDRRQARAPTTQEVKAVVAFAQARSSGIGKARWAAVAADSANYGMSRMAQFLLEGTSVTLGVFRDPDDAETWVREGQDAIGKRYARG